MKTQDEIVQYLKRPNPSFFGFDKEVLLSFLDFEHAKGFFTEGLVSEQDWSPPKPLTREIILDEMKTYMRDYGWPKVQDHRGISASRTVDKMEAWGFALEGQEFVDALEKIPYPSYGAPKLKWICEKFGWPIPDNDEALKKMMNGEPCSDDCTGCRS